MMPTKAPEADPKPAGTLNIGQKELGPYQGHPKLSGNPQIFLNQLISAENLVMHSAESSSEFLPMLAESWSLSDDNLSWTFKLRKGMPVGFKATLRGNVMWDFLFRLIAIALPNIRDFRGVSPLLDGHGNYTLGSTDHSIFPEINVERQRTNVGLDVCIVTSAATDEEGRELFSLLGMPFRKISTEQQEDQEAAA